VPVAVWEQLLAHAEDDVDLDAAAARVATNIGLELGQPEVTALLGRRRDRRLSRDPEGASPGRPRPAGRRREKHHRRRRPRAAITRHPGVC